MSLQAITSQLRSICMHLEDLDMVVRRVPTYEPKPWGQ